MDSENIGVVFGPTLMRPKVETTAQLMSGNDKCVVRQLIDLHHFIFPASADSDSEHTDVDMTGSTIRASSSNSLHDKLSASGKRESLEKIGDPSSPEARAATDDKRELVMRLSLYQSSSDEEEDYEDDYDAYEDGEEDEKAVDKETINGTPVENASATQDKFGHELLDQSATSVGDTSSIDALEQQGPGTSLGISEPDLSALLGKVHDLKCKLDAAHKEINRLKTVNHKLVSENQRIKSLLPIEKPKAPNPVVPPGMKKGASLSNLHQNG